MTRPFSLRRLFAFVTALCVIFALAAAFPVIAYRYVKFASLFLPALFVCTLLDYISNHKKPVFRAAVVGAFVTWFFSPDMNVQWSSPPNWWGLYTVDLQRHGMPAAIGAAVVGGITWLVVARQPHFFQFIFRRFRRRSLGARLRQSAYPQELSIKDTSDDMPSSK
jgi:hypothetical protein